MPQPRATRPVQIDGVPGTFEVPLDANAEEMRAAAQAHIDGIRTNGRMPTLMPDMPKVVKPVGVQGPPEMSMVEHGIESAPEVAGLLGMLIPEGKIPGLLTQIAKIGLPAMAEVGRQLADGEKLDLGKLAMRTGANAMPIAIGKGATAAADAAGMGLTRQSLSSGLKAATPDVEALAAGGSGMAAGADVTKMARVATREGSELNVKSAQDAAKYAKELSVIKTRGLNSTAQQAYLRARPQVAAALQRAGGNVDSAIAEFEGLASTLAKATEGAARKGFQIYPFVRNLGMGGALDSMSGMPGVGTTVGAVSGALQASPAIKYKVGQALAQHAGQTGPTIEALLRTLGVAASSTAPPSPERRRLRGAP